MKNDEPMRLAHSRAIFPRPGAARTARRAAPEREWENGTSRAATSSPPLWVRRASGLLRDALDDVAAVIGAVLTAWLICDWVLAMCRLLGVV